MAKVIVLARAKAFQGVWTQRKKVWEFLEHSEHIPSSSDTVPIPYLFIRTPNGREIISGISYSPCTYANLCNCLRKQGRIVLCNEHGEVLYSVWECVLNEPFVLLEG